MDLLQDLPKYKELLEQYGDDLIGFITFIQGYNHSLTHREIVFLSRVKCPGCCVKEPNMFENAPLVALWYFLFRPSSYFVYIAKNQEKEKLFIHGIRLLLDYLKKTEHAWILNYIQVKQNSISIVDSYTCIRTKSGKLVHTHLAGFNGPDLMIWIDQHKEQTHENMYIAKGCLTAATHRLVLA